MNKGQNILKWIALFCVIFVSGCINPNSNPNPQAADALFGPIDAYRQQVNDQNSQWNANQQQLNAQDQQNNGSKVWNPVSKAYQFIPPGWHNKGWDANTQQWVVQP